MNQELIELQHKYKIEEIEFEMKCKMAVERLKHENEMETNRIKSAEIRKNLMRQQGDSYR